MIAGGEVEIPPHWKEAGPSALALRGRRCVGECPLGWDRQGAVPGRADLAESTGGLGRVGGPVKAWGRLG